MTHAKIVVDRRAVVSEQGLVLDYLTVHIRNTGDTPLALTQFPFSYTETSADLVRGVSASTDWVPRWRYWPRLPSSLLLIEVPHVVEPNSDYFLCAATRREGLVEKSGETLRFDDTLLDLAFDMPNWEFTVEGRATIVFPAQAASTSTVVSEVAATTSRTASWTVSLSGGGVKTFPLRAARQPSALQTAPTRLDDAIADLHVAWCEIAFEGSTDWKTLRSKLQKVLALDASPLAQELPQERLDALDVIQAVIARCHLIRDEQISKNIRPALFGGAGPLSLFVAREIERAGLSRPPVYPEGLRESLGTVAQYVVAQRKAPTKWTAGVRESEFQRDFKAFLRSRQETDPEIGSGRGRVDFRVGNTPTELKVAHLREGQIPANNLQQAAEYAASRSVSVAFLLILDTSPNIARHLPHPLELVSVHAVKSTKGNVRESETLVVAFVINAFPSAPSRLTGAALASPTA